MDRSGRDASRRGMTGGEYQITAIPRLLRQIDVKGATVSLDAMGCQKRIAQEIHFAGGDYLLALKGNHGTLHGEVVALFEDPEALAYGREKGAKVTQHQGGAEKGHGRIENRCHWVLDVTFSEDQCRARMRHAAQNLALLRKLTLNLLRSDQTIKDTIRGKRIQAMLCEDILETLMKIKVPK
jgi:predicted transposase YbfD/YdcC